MVKDKTGGERQSRLRLARSKWLKEHGFNSAEGLLGALMRGEVVLQVASVPTKRAADICPRCEGVGQYVDYIGKRFLLPVRWNGQMPLTQTVRRISCK